ncbi:hypothetical protein [Roseibium sp.]|uniref:hypothetical protein n=1 Tax=Roseibium sp. TaxID=1936156 RepID=UPI003BA892FA
MYDQKHVDRIGKLKNCVGYGPGTLGLALKPDDDAGVIDTLVSVKAVARSLVELLVKPH